MSTAKKLSTWLSTEASDAQHIGNSDDHTWFTRRAAEARALEERVAELEGAGMGFVLRQRDVATARVAELEQKSNTEAAKFIFAIGDATARAEAAEADLAATERENERLVAALEAAEFEVARLRRNMRVEVENHEATIATVDRLIIERDALRAKLEKVRAEAKAYWEDWLGDADIAPEDRADGYHDIIALIDGEGSDE